MKIAFVTTCKNRTQHLSETLPANIDGNPNSKFIVLDYNSQDGLRDYIRTAHGRALNAGQLTLYSHTDAPVFRMGHAKNMAARLGMLEGADVLVTLDADNFTGAGFEDFIADHLSGPQTFLCPDFPRIKSLPHGPLRPARGYAGRLAIRAQDFLKMGGYDETFETWRGEDIDLIARMNRVGFAMKTIDNRYLNAIAHNSEVRFAEYPHAKQYETQGEWANITNRAETIVNYGKIGCGTVFRNLDFSDPFALTPVPTRIFGIGMQKTATTSLHEAFKILGYDSFHWETNRLAWRLYNEVRTSGRSSLVDKYDAFCDNPLPLIYRELDAAYPGSKFILTTREDSNWLASARGLFDPHVNPHYDWEQQPFSHRIHEALYGRRDFDADTMLARYRWHNVEVRNYFRNRPQDLLVMEMDKGAGWPELCNFLGNAQVPTQAYPRAYAQY